LDVLAIQINKFIKEVDETKEEIKYEI